MSERPRRPAPRTATATAAAARREPPDHPRLAAWELLRTVDADNAYANLALPALLTRHRLSGRDAALATELGYGTLRATGTLDLIIGRCVDRPLADVQQPVLDVLRLGAYQLLRTRIPPHAAVAATVALSRSAGHGRASGFVNAVLRKVAARDWDLWCDELSHGLSPRAALAVRTAHPDWIVEAFAAALQADGPPTEVDVDGDGDGDVDVELAAALAADDDRPVTHLVAWPPLSSVTELVEATGGHPGPYSAYAVRMDGGDPALVPAIGERRAGVQDEGSQLCVLALAAAPVSGRDERWLDLCAGPGGKAALLAAIGAQRGARLTANELRPRRAELVREVTAHWQVEVRVGDARELAPRNDGSADDGSADDGSADDGSADDGYDRVLVDAPCTGLGALRRRPEARWRRQPSDLAELVELQRELLDAALRLTRPGGVVGYVTCSPHQAETRAVLAAASVPHEVLDAREYLPGVDQLGPGPAVQLWPHRHGTDAMFCALLRRR